jgi:glutamate-1-semialdehyde 2,1-aminomutase
MLIDGLNEAASAAGMPARAYGEPLAPMPFFKFTSPDDGLNAVLERTFYSEVLARGILLHPRHMWFVSLAHADADIERTIDTASVALRLTADRHL